MTAAARSVEVLVIGAGPTGIGAAAELAARGIDHLVVEAGRGPGGMASSVHDEHGFTWDLGGHVIHSHFEAFDKAVVASGVPMRSVRRRGAVWADGEMIPTPIQKHLAELPTDLRQAAPSANLSEYYRNNFGSGLAGSFLEPHTTKMWAHPLTTVAHEWTSQRGGSAAANVPSLGLAADRPEPVDEYFPYPEGGTGRLWEGVFVALCDPDAVRFATRVAGLDLAARVATLDDGSTVHYRHCVNTAPLTEVVAWTGLPLPPEVAPLASSTVHAIGFGFTGAPPDLLADKSYLYCAAADVPWYRATMLSNYDPGNAGPGRWNVLCEVSTSGHRPITLADAVAGCRRSLAGLGADLDSVVTEWTMLVPHGYPVPTLGRDDVLRPLDAELRAHGVFSRGRFGGWRYESCNQDYSYVQGIEAVAHIVDGSEELVYWHPELF